MRKLNTLLATAMVALAVMGSNGVKAQDSRAVRLGIGANPGIATEDPYGFVLGGDLKLQKDFVGPLSATLTTGFTHFFVKDEFDAVADPYNVIPLKAGLKLFVKSPFYVSAEAGAGFGTDNGAGTSFVWSPALGWAFNNGIDVGLKYEDFTKYEGTKQVALRIAYGFNLSR